MIDSIYILGCKALYLFFCIFTDKPVYCDYDGKRSYHAEERMWQKVLSAQHLVKSGRQAKQNAGKQSEDFSAAAVENKIQRHKGETGCGVSGGKTASGFGLHETFRIAVDNADKRVKGCPFFT